MVFSKEKQYVKTLNVNENDIIYFQNENSSDAINFKTTLSPNEIIKKLGAVVIEKQNLKNENLKIYYCYVENVSSFVVENGKKINLQIAYNGEFSIVGFPLILTGYWFLNWMYKKFFCVNNCVVEEIKWKIT